MTAPASLKPIDAVAATSNLRAGGWALLIACAPAAAAWILANATIAASAPLLESRADAVRSRGVAVVRTRLQRRDAVPVFGSSELAYDVKNRVDRFFSTAPTGFTVLPIGGKAMTPLIHALAIQALGDALSERPIIIALSPFSPTRAGRRQEWFSGNFSRLHASIALTSNAIPAALRRETARQLIEYPDALRSDPILKLVVHIESVDSPLALVLSAFVRPIAWLDRLWLTLVDRVVGARDVLENQARVGDVQIVPLPIDWPALEQTARDEYALASDSNPFGLSNSWWATTGVGTMAQYQPVSDSVFAHRLDAWSALKELETLVRSAHAVGARVLVVNLPYNGLFMDAIGISRTARQTYYDRVQAVGRRLGITLVDHREYDLDRALLDDPEAHLSPVGWLNFNHAVDDFVRHINP